MAAPLFLFVQLEFASQLGPPDGRYLLRASPDAEPERVVVMETVGAPVRPSAAARLARRISGPRDVEPEPDAEPVPVTLATVIDPGSVPAEAQAEAWLRSLDGAAALAGATVYVNRVLAAYRVARADPHVHEVDERAAVAARAGWGEGEQVAYGRWRHAQALPTLAADVGGRRARTAALRPQERLAALLGGRTAALECEELALRARADLEHGRPALAALELDRALGLAARELQEEVRPDLLRRAGELADLHDAVKAQADAALAGADEVDSQPLEEALARLQAALRARTAAGVS
ncbi:MAG TPA: hypothetical protein VMA83_08900 [Solirubrobacteraceae bacterium]|nr:hypothetical protein [Solirubrobacteraceae bacterium]